MALPTISVINFTNQLDDREVQNAIRAVNRQIREDFASVWGATWELRLHASAFDALDPESLIDEAIQGEAVLYLVDEAHVAGALGYHGLNAAETPYGFVFMTVPSEWTVTLSHEALELIVDPTANVLVPGPDPRAGQSDNIVLHTYEVCDAVERTSYEIDGVRVSNFITQQWFFPNDAPGTRNDFLGVGVSSFGATPGSHLAFLDLQTGWQQILGASARDLAPPMMARQQIFEHDRTRPEEGLLLEILQKSKAAPPTRLRDRAEGGLTRVEAFTRTERKRLAAERLYRQR